MIKKFALTIAAAGMIGMSATGVASADELDCGDFSTPVIIQGGFDPNHLDADGDGVGCEANPGSPVAYETYTEGEQLAATGIGPTTHPVRWMVISGSLLAVGGVVVTMSRTRKGIQ